MDIVVAQDEVDRSSPWSPKGRFARLSFLAWSVLLGIGVGIFMLAAAHGRLLAIGMIVGGMVGMIVASIVGILIGLLAGIVFVIFVIRRLHDVGTTGWWSLLLVVPFVNIVFGLVLACVPGNGGANRFGLPRITRVWERNLGYLAIGLITLLMLEYTRFFAISFLRYGYVPW